MKCECGADEFGQGLDIGRVAKIKHEGMKK